ncbi:MAG: translocation/assembly module TamB domain-containing protein [Gemmatimonadaceae bacterium]
MTRRRAVVLVSAAVLLGLGGALALGVAMLTRTDYGREQIRSFVEGAMNRASKGKIHIGRISGSIFSDLRIDTLAIREANDSLFVSTGPITLTFNPLDLLDRRIYATHARVSHPVVRVQQDSAGTWNFRKIFPPGPKGPPRKATQGQFGDYISVDSAFLDSVEVRVVMPWVPNDSLRGAKLDSALKFNLTRQDRVIRRVGERRFEQTWIWSQGRMAIAHARVDDHTALGRQFEISRLDVDEFFPPFKFRAAAGRVRLLGDSLWLDLPHFDLPASTGSGSGKVWWGGGQPTRYDLSIVGDSVALADVNWVYPTLPKSGGGKMKLRIHNERDLHVLDYVITDMDVRTTGSRLRGDVTFGSGADVLIVKDVNVRADPMDWAFLHQINGKPLPYPWRGTLTGHLRAAGGPVNRFKVDSADFVFQDANVPGAWGKMRGRGELDILFPAFTVFRGFDLQVDQFDLRSIQFLNPNFPRFDGIVSGSARLDSSWLDLRFRNADVTHRDGPGVPNHFTGNGRVTFGEKFLTYDLAMEAAPISFGTVAHAYREIPLPYRGEYSGPIRMQGTMEDLDLSADIRGVGGTLNYEGKVDADSVGGYAADGVFRFRDLDLRVLFDTSAVPHTALNGEAIPRVRFDSLATANGALAVDLERSAIDSMRVYNGSARLRFGEGLMTVDSLAVESVAGTLTARGRLGISPEIRDSLQFAIRSDSLGGFRRQYLRSFAADTAALRSAASDSMSGRLTIDGVLLGSVDSLGLRATGLIEGLAVGETSARSAHLTADLKDLTGVTHGQVTLTGDTVGVVGLSLHALAGTADVRSPSEVGYRVGVTAVGGGSAEGEGVVRLAADTVDVGMESLRLKFGDDRWELARPSRVTTTTAGIRIDPIVLEGEGGSLGRITVQGTIPKDSAVMLMARADSVSMRDLGVLAQTGVTLGGRLTAQLDIKGTKMVPTMALRGTVEGGAVGSVELQRILVNGSYADRRAQAKLDVVRNGTTVLDVSAALPADLRLASTPRRMLDDTLHIGFRSRDVDMAILEGFVPSLKNAVGRLNADFAIRGRMRHATLNGFVRIDSAAANIEAMGGERVRDVFLDLQADHDSIEIRRMVATSGPERGDSLWVKGTVSLFGADTLPSYSLQLGARSFRVVVRPRVADLQLSANLSLEGSPLRSSLTGGATIDRGIIYIPEFFEKDIVSLDDPDLFNIVDTSVVANRTLLPKAPPRMLQNLDVRNVAIAMGPDVRLRSDEANIKLGGAVNMTVARNRGSSSASSRNAQAALALDGRLRTEQGTYILDLGVVQRVLSIEGGELRFFGDADLNPAVDIRALHVVRQFNDNATRNDIRVRVKLQGTFLQPRVSFESADSLNLSESDLISYLVTGAPSLEIGGTRGTGVSFSSLFLSSVSSRLAQSLTGRFFDQVQIQSAQNQLQGTVGSAAKTAIFNGLQFGLGKQINDRTWVSFQAGLCTTGSQGSLGSFNPQSIGVKVEHTLKKGYGVSFGVEPGASAVFCGQERGFAPTPQQFGLDFYRAWRF